MTEHTRRADRDRQRDRPSDDVDAHRDLTVAVRTLLGGSLGVNLGGAWLSERLSAKLAGLAAVSLYACIPSLQFAIGGPTALIILSWWGAIYVGIVVALTRSTGPWVEETVETLVVPTLSDAAARTALVKIRSEFRRPQLISGSLLTSLIFVSLSWLFLRRYPLKHVALWSVGYAYLYFTAALVTLTSRFYLCFSSAIKQNPEQLFRLDPSNSPVIFASRALGNRMLRYWFCVFLLVVTFAIVPFIARRVAPNDVDTLQQFVFAVIAVAGFFSFVFGSLVYLRFESDIRNAVERVRLQTLVELQGQYVERFQAAPALPDADQKRLDQLKSACELLSKGELTRTASKNVLATLVTILPAVAGILAAVTSLLSSGRRAP